MCGQFSLVRQGDFHLDIRLIVLRVTGNELRVGHCLGDLRDSVRYPFQRTRNRLVCVGIDGVVCHVRGEIAQPGDRHIVAGHIDVTLLDVTAAFGAIGCCPGDLHQELLLQRFEVLLVERGRMEGRSDLIAVAVVRVVTPGAGIQDLSDIVFVRPLPPACYRGAVGGNGNIRVFDNVAGGLVPFVSLDILPLYQLLAVAQRGDGIPGADIQLCGSDGEGQVLRLVRIAVRPQAVGGVSQLQRDRIVTRVRTAIVALHGVVGSIGKAGFLKRPVVDRGRDRGEGHLLLAHADRCLNGSRFVVARLTGGKDHRIGEIAGSIETGGRSLPRKAARHIALVRGIGRHVDGDTAQFAAQVGGVCRRTAEDRGRADDGNGVAVFPAGRTDKGVQIRVGTAGQFAAGNTHQPDIRGAGGDTGLLEHSAGNAYAHAIDPVAGSNIGDVEAALSAAVHVQLASHVFDGVRHHIEFEL